MFDANRKYVLKDAQISTDEREQIKPYRRVKHRSIQYKAAVLNLRLIVLGITS